MKLSKKLLVLLAIFIVSSMFFSACASGPSKPNSIVNPTETFSTRSAQASPTPTVSDKPGRINPVCIDAYLTYRSANVNAELKQLQILGVNCIRFDFPHSAFEQSRGVWDFGKWDIIVQKASALHIQVIALLNTTDTPYWEYPQNNPYDVRFLHLPTEYADYVGHVAKWFKNRIKLYELGNEEDATGIPAPNGNATAYVALLKVGSEAIRVQDPNAKIISGGLTAEHFKPFLLSMYANGAIGYYNYLGFHDYAGNTPRSLALLDEVHQIMIQHGDGNTKIMVTEDGFPTVSPASEPAQASYLSAIFKAVEFGNYNFVAKVCVYELVDEPNAVPDDPADPENHFGLLRSDYLTNPTKAQKPAFLAVKQAEDDFKSHFSELDP